MPMLYGSRIRLRAPEREDIPAFLRWVNDPEVCEYLEQYTAFNREMEESWYESVVKGPAIELPLVIEVKTSQSDTWVPIGNTAFMGFHQVNRSAEIGIMIGEKEYWDQGYGTEALQLMCNYGFNTLNLHRIFLRVFEGNERGKKAYRKVGFVYEGTMRQARFHQGRYWDVDIMSILQSDWKLSLKE